MSEDNFEQYMEQSGRDDTKVKQGGALPAAGVALVRFMEYVELGLQKSKNPAYKDARECHLAFELVGRRHNIVNGDNISHPKILASVNLTNSPKGGFIPLFKALNYAGTAKRITELLGSAYLSKVTHVKNEDGSKSFARIKVKDEPWPISPPIKVDPEDPELSTVIDVPKAKGKILRFVWEPSMLPDELYLETWDSLFIEGAWEDGNSKNKLQEKIMKNLEWKGSRLERLLEARAAGVSADLPEDIDGEEDVY